MADAHDKVDLDAMVLETIEFVQVEAHGDGWRGRTPDWYEGAMFGGFVLGQAVHAATRTAPEHTRIHSLHAYFLAPVATGSTVDYQVRPLRDGRRFSSRLLEATQDGRPVFTMTCSFAGDGDGYEYGAPLDAGVPAPETLATEANDGPFETASLGPTEPGPHGVRSSTHRIWIRAARPLPDDPHLHDAFRAYITDITWTGTRPLDLDGDTRGIVSLDHAIWFHRPARADDWMFHDAHSLVNTLGRGLLRGSIYGADRQLAASVTQETLLRTYDQFTA